MSSNRMSNKENALHLPLKLSSAINSESESDLNKFNSIWKIYNL